MSLVAGSDEELIVLSVSSQDRTANSYGPGKFTVQLREPIQNITKARLASAQFPRLRAYVFTNVNDWIDIMFSHTGETAGYRFEEGESWNIYKKHKEIILGGVTVLRIEMSQNMSSFRFFTDVPGLTFSLLFKSGPHASQSAAAVFGFDRNVDILNVTDVTSTVYTTPLYTGVDYNLLRIKGFPALKTTNGLSDITGKLEWFNISDTYVLKDTRTAIINFLPIKPNLSSLEIEYLNSNGTVQECGTIQTSLTLELLCKKNKL